MKTIDLKLNGLSGKYGNSISGLVAISTTAAFCARLDAIVLARKNNDIGSDRFKGALDGLTWAAVDAAPKIIAEGGKDKLLQHFGDTFDSTYDEKYRKSLMHGDKGTSAYSDLIGAFGEAGAVTKQTLSVLASAAAFDKQHGISAS